METCIVASIWEQHMEDGCQLGGRDMLHIQQTGTTHQGPQLGSVDRRCSQPLVASLCCWRITPDESSPPRTSLTRWQGRDARLDTLNLCTMSSPACQSRAMCRTRASVAACPRPCRDVGICKLLHKHCTPPCNRVGSPSHRPQQHSCIPPVMQIKIEGAVKCG